MNNNNRIDLITLGQIRDANPCAEGWAKLLTGLGYTSGKPDLTRVVSLGDIATTNDAQDALWATRCLPHTIEARRYRVSLLLPTLRRIGSPSEVVDGLAAWVAGDDSIDLDALCRAGARAAAWAADAAAEAAWAADAAAGAAGAAARAARAAGAAEREQQRADIIALSPLYALAGEGGTHG